MKKLSLLVLILLFVFGVSPVFSAEITSPNTIQDTSRNGIFGGDLTIEVNDSADDYKNKAISRDWGASIGKALKDIAERVLKLAKRAVTFDSDTSDNVTIAGELKSEGINAGAGDITTTGKVTADDFVKSDGSPVGGGAEKWVDGTATGTINYANGNVGIGTTSPRAKLEINAATTSYEPFALFKNTGRRGLQIESFPNHTDSDYDDALGIMASSVNQDNTKDLVSFGLSVNGHHRGQVIAYPDRTDPTNNSKGTLAFRTRGDLGDGSTNKMRDRMTILSNGNVGIGTTNPRADLEVKSAGGTIAAVGTGYPALYITNESKSSGSFGRSWAWMNYGSGLYLNAYAGTSTSLAPGGPRNAMFIKDSNQYVGIGTTSPSTKLHVVGSFRVDGTCYSRNGGNHGVGADCKGITYDIAELIPAESPVSGAGVLLEFSAKNPGKTKETTTAYSTKIAGIVSTSPAILFEGDSVITMSEYKVDPLKPAIALAGRVPTKVTNANGNISVGDFITSSQIPGVGMKCPIDTPEQKLKCFGAVVGKAMESCDAESCVINVFVKSQ